MICSTIIPTIGRASLSRAVTSVLEQPLDAGEFEVIVVNDSGRSLETQDWMASPRVTILHTNRHNRSVARNTGAAVAKGRYLHFLDDDDYILPGAFQKLWQAASKGQPGWIFAGFRLVDHAGDTLKEIRPGDTGNLLVQLLASEWLPLQASWIESAAFFAVGGFASLQSLEGGYEDIDLSRMVALRSEFVGIQDLAAVIRFGDAGSTTDYNNLIRQNRRSREKVLDAPGALKRLRASAKAAQSGSSYWLGQIVYYYLGSVAWNIKQKQVARAVSRLASASAAVLGAGASLFTPGFWHGAARPHHNLVRVSLGELGKTLYSSTSWQR